MKHLSLTALTLLWAAATMPAFSQVSNDNEDGVYKIDRTSATDFVPGQVLVKLKDSAPAQVRRNAKGKFLSAGVGNLDKVLQEFGVEEMEQLLPHANTSRTPRRAKAYSGDIVEERDLTQLYKVVLPEEKAGQTMQMVERLKGLGEVEFAEPNYKLYITDAMIAESYSDNPMASQQWYLDNYGVKELWTKPIINPKRPVIAILDTGVDMTHPDLVDNLWINTAEANGEEGYDNDGNGFAGDVHGWDFINNTPNVRDFNMHGTHVAGIAAASNNGIGIVGANPQALIMPISVMQSDGTGDVATIIKGIDYAVQNGADVLNFSLGTYANSLAMRQSLERAYQTAVIVAAAGNDGKCVNSPHHPIPCFGAAPMFPAAYSVVLGVQATTNTGSLAKFSNYDDDGGLYSCYTTFQDPDGFNYELKAPGTNMLSTIPGGKYKVLQGTSMAAPLVAGAVSALKMVKQYDTQEILWGDLLHTHNIAEAYAVTERPAELDMLNIQMRNRKELSDETEEDYSGDHEIDAGETVSIYPVIRTTFGEASNIKMHLEMGDEFEDPNTVEFLTNVVDFGLHLDAYGKGVSLNPLQVKIADNIADNRHIKLKVVAVCDESEDTIEWPFTVVVVNMVKISGLISEDRTLTADHVYYVNDNLAITEGATLTIEPGTRLEFASGKMLSSFGKLKANGTPEKPIVFTGYHSAYWGGMKTHESKGQHSYWTNTVFTNDEQTLFTLLPSEATPNKLDVSIFTKHIYYKDGENYTGKGFSFLDYVNGWNHEMASRDMTARQDLLTDPDFITPALQQMKQDIEDYCNSYATEWSEEYPNDAYVQIYNNQWYIYDNPRDTISYCRLDHLPNTATYLPYLKDCVVTCNNDPNWGLLPMPSLVGVRNNIVNGYIMGAINEELTHSNLVNLCVGGYAYSNLHSCNYFNNNVRDSRGRTTDYMLDFNPGSPAVDKAEYPSYLGTSREDLVRPHICEMGNGGDGYGRIDLSNMPAQPFAEAHGIVWKVCVNGKDAQDEFEDLPPLGVGRHKFEVYFNRPMNVAVAPQISFGVRDPWTQNTVAEDGSWSADSLVYTAYKTIDGKTKSDGVNRIYVWGAEDNEYFEIPYEKTRFNINIQAAGSMATGFAAEAKMGRVDLTWNNENNDFDDAMGFNIYRYGESYQKILPAGWRDDGKYYSNPDTIMVADTLRLNREIVDIETTEFTDYDVKPGTTYHYYYKVLSTGLTEYDVSNVVAATPLTSTLGDANGSGDVDVADVITTVNYAAGMEPKPFIFEAADMNTDLSIDILDVIGIIKKILNPDAEVKAAVEAVATYTIKDGTLYVESPVALAGVQVQLSDSQFTMHNSQFRVADDLNGFEHTSAWLSDNDYLFLAYNMNGKTLDAGKHALLHIGTAKIADIRFSDSAGHNVEAMGDEATRVNRMASDVMTVPGIYDLQGRKITGNSAEQSCLPKGVYIINGRKVVR